MNIGLDFDGVICDCRKLKKLGLQKFFGLDLTSSKVSKEYVTGAGLLSPEEYALLQSKIYREREIMPFMEEVSGARAAISRLKADGHSVSVVTMRYDVSADIAHEWMKQHDLSLRVVSSHGTTKADFARGLDVFIDDDADNLAALEGLVAHRLLFAWRYNAHQHNLPGIAVVNSWPEAYEYITTL